MPMSLVAIPALIAEMYRDILSDLSNTIASGVPRICRLRRRSHRLKPAVRYRLLGCMGRGLSNLQWRIKLDIAACGACLCQNRLWVRAECSGEHHFTLRRDQAAGAGLVVTFCAADHKRPLSYTLRYIQPSV